MICFCGKYIPYLIQIKKIQDRGFQIEKTFMFSSNENRKRCSNFPREQSLRCFRHPERFIFDIIFELQKFKIKGQSVFKLSTFTLLLYYRSSMISLFPRTRIIFHYKVSKLHVQENTYEE